MYRYYESIQIVSKYIKYRPKLVPEIAEFITSNMKRNSKTKTVTHWDTLLDVGCGGGQATSLLAPYFDNVYGIDVSEQQILMAKQLCKGRDYVFKVAPAEHLPFQNESVDLVSCSVAAHWLDYDKFVSEAWRVLKPGGGHIAIFCYFYPEIVCPNKFNSKQTQSKTNSAQRQFETFVQKCNNHPNIVHHLFDQKYDDIYENLPGENKVIDRSLVLQINGTLVDFRGTFHSSDGYEQHMLAVHKNMAISGEKFDKNKHDILEDLIQGIKARWQVTHLKDEEVQVDQIFKTCTIVSQKKFD